MKKINIHINQAKLLSYEVNLGEELDISAVIGLFAGTKKSALLLYQHEAIMITT